nr:MAG TPA: hypothetical protein [Caudoviricetes sp.]
MCSIVRFLYFSIGWGNGQGAGDSGWVVGASTVGAAGPAARQMYESLTPTM